MTNIAKRTHYFLGINQGHRRDVLFNSYLVNDDADGIPVVLDSTSDTVLSDLPEWFVKITTRSDREIYTKVNDLYHCIQWRCEW